MNRVEPNRNVYVGHRYVPLLVGEWDKTIQYEGLSIVTYKGGSYTSKKMTPPGIDIENEEYWVFTANYDAQVEYYRLETKRVKEYMEELDERLTTDLINTREYVDDEVGKNREYVDGEVETLTGYVNDEVQQTKEYVDDETASARQYVDDEVLSKVDGTIESIDYYVSPDGNDNNDGSSDSPFRTIKKAIDIMPDIIRQGHVFKIYIDEGDFNETILIRDKTVNGKLIIEGTTNNRDKHRVYNVDIFNIIGNLEINNITTTKINSGAAIRFTSSQPYMRVQNVKTLYDTTSPGVSGRNLIGLLGDFGSNVLVRDSDFSGRRYGIRSNYLSTVTSINNTGELNHRGVGSRFGGITFCYNSQPKGTNTNFTTSSGGIISKGRGFLAGLDMEDYYITGETQSGQDGNYYKRSYNITDIMNRSTELDDGDIISLKMRTSIHGPARINIKYGGQWASQNIANQHFEVVLTGVLNNSNIGNLSKNFIYNSNFNEDDIDIVYIDENVFEIRIKTSGSIRNRWACEVESQLMRRGDAPELLEVSII